MHNSVDAADKLIDVQYLLQMTFTLLSDFQYTDAQQVCAAAMISNVLPLPYSLLSQSELQVER